MEDTRENVDDRNYYLTRRRGDWFVVGSQMFLAVRDCEEGRKVIAEMQSIDRLKATEG